MATSLLIVQKFCQLFRLEFYINFTFVLATCFTIRFSLWFHFCNNILQSIQIRNLLRNVIVSLRRSLHSLYSGTTLHIILFWDHSPHDSVMGPFSTTFGSGTTLHNILFWDHYPHHSVVGPLSATFCSATTLHIIP